MVMEERGGKEEGEMARGREGEERRGRARLGYLSSLPSPKVQVTSSCQQIVFIL